MDLLPQLIVSGLSAGSVYALTALGIVWIFRCYGVMNFAHGEMAMFSTFVAYWLLSAARLPMGVALAGAVLVAFALGALSERLVRSVRRSPLGMMILTLGLLMAINGLAGVVFGNQPRRFPDLWPGDPIVLGSVVASRQDVFIFAATALLVLLLYGVLKFTRFGLAARAATHKPDVARLMGVNVSLIFLLSWGISVALGAVAGVLVAPGTQLEPNMMGSILVKAFTGAVLGGFSSLAGAFAGGLLLGILDNLVGFYVALQWKDTLALLTIVLVLLLRPEGLLGAGERRLKRA